MFKVIRNVFKNEKEKGDAPKVRIHSTCYPVGYMRREDLNNKRKERT